METKELIENFSTTRPFADIIVGYGSGVKKQDNDKGLEKQIDLILGVGNVELWHQQNFEINPTDYSSLGFKLFSYYKNLGTKINYLTFLPYDNHMFKIGVVSTKDLFDDLINWKSFYLAGRFQKPIEIIRGNDELDHAITINRLNALKIALLLSNSTSITEKKLYETICSLSFIGDWRQIFHLENPHKIVNIVNGSFSELQEIYQALNNYCIGKKDGVMFIDYFSLFNNLDTLPSNLLKKLNKYKDKSANLIIKILLDYLTKMNIKASAAQPIKGFLLNGGLKTKIYLKQKINKSKI